ncbi:MAG: hypothetical protein JSR66_17290 [Proteobacteria bacterium]|nr:hypothetical protein [Pseudomonadota bacterium]
MKTASSPDLQDAQPGVSTTGAKPDTQYVTVYTFYVYDHDQGKPVIYPRMATPAAVAKMRGKLNEDSAWVVEASTLDVEGFYSESNGKPRR